MDSAGQRTYISKRALEKYQQAKQQQRLGVIPEDEKEMEQTLKEVEKKEWSEDMKESEICQKPLLAPS